MNAKHSLCTISMVVALLCFAGEIKAQSRYERVLLGNLWNDGVGVNGIRLDRVDAAEATLSAGWEQGGLKEAWEAPSLWSAGAMTRAIRHLEHFSMTGAFAFNQRQGDDMCGPMSIEPGYFPIEVWEFTPGRKTLQSYVVDGGISVDLDESWRFGGRFTMNSRNYSKRKDLRHINYRLDLDCAAGLMWHCGALSLEMDALLGRTAETISADQIGLSQGYLYAFLDKGQMYGVQELWTGSGVHLADAGVNSLPMRENSLGAALEAGWKDKAFASLQYRHARGRAGEKEYIWYRFPSDQMTLHLGGRLGDHTLRLCVSLWAQTNNEAVLDKKSEGGVTIVTSYGSNRILERQRLELAPSYRYDHGPFTLRASLFCSRERSLSSLMYPYLMRQDTDMLEAQLGGRYHSRLFEVELYAGYSAGSLSGQEDMADEVQVEGEPYRYAEGFATVCEFISMPKAFAGLKARWYPGGKGWFLGVDAYAALGLKPAVALSGMTRTNASLSIGLDF
ncbi:MAG: DUF6850 family outer membrane beta-barrel protein [Candidatus Cryptobacteroides sp.]